MWLLFQYNACTLHILIKSRMKHVAIVFSTCMHTPHINQRDKGACGCCSLVQCMHIPLINLSLGGKL